jgi:hypothetical protein
MKDFIGEALAKPANRFRIPLSRDRTYVPLFDAPKLQSMGKDGILTSTPASSTIIGSSHEMQFFRIRTDMGRELVADAQRALYIMPPGRTSRQLVRVDELRIGAQVLCSNDEGTETRLETVTSIEEVRDG